MIHSKAIGIRMNPCVKTAMCVGRFQRHWLYSLVYPTPSFRSRLYEIHTPSRCQSLDGGHKRSKP